MPSMEFVYLLMIDDSALLICYTLNKKFISAEK